MSKGLLIRIFENRSPRVKYRHANGGDLRSARVMLRPPNARGFKAIFVLPIMIALVAVALLGVIATPAAAGPAAPYFGAMVRVDQAPGYQGGQSSMAIGSDGVIYLAYSGWGGSTTGTDVFFTKSSNGRTWTVPLRVNDDSGGTAQTEPTLTLDPSNNVYIAWTDGRSGNNDAKGPDIYYVKSTNLGGTWGTVVIVNRDTGNAAQAEPTIAVNASGAIFVAWTDSSFTSTAPDIAATVSTNGGASFPVAVKVNDDAGTVQQGQPTLAVRGDRAQLAWSDYRTGGPYPYAIYTSSYDGVSWSANVQVNGDTGVHFEANPAVGIDAAGDIVVAWTSWSVVTVFPVPIIQQEILASVRDVVAPTASAGSSATVDQGTAASFDGSGSADNLGIASASWDFGDGSTSMGLTASHSYANPGLYMATLTVWDNSGNAATATRSVTVRDTAAPIPRGGGDRTADEGQSLFFDGSASSDNVAVTSYLWDFGDGSNATSATATHVYARTGTYTAKLTVRDAAGNPATTQFTVTIRPNGLLTYIEILGGIVGLLLILVGLLTWMVLGVRKKGLEHAPRAASGGNPMPPPPTDGDPLDMSLPPKGA